MAKQTVGNLGLERLEGIHGVVEVMERDHVVDHEVVLQYHAKSQTRVLGKENNIKCQVEMNIKHWRIVVSEEEVG